MIKIYLYIRFYVEIHSNVEMMMMSDADEVLFLSQDRLMDIYLDKILIYDTKSKKFERI